jgi:N-acetylglutamate synthase-like GNAT family acetyltransferase
LVTGQIGELEDLFVDPDWMRRGIATKLVLDALANAREQGIARIDMTANGHALAFYKKVGFAQPRQAPALSRVLRGGGRAPPPPPSCVTLYPSR